MTRNRAYDLGASLLAVAAAVVAGVAVAFPALAGCAVLLTIGAGAFALLRVRSRIRSESRHRWTLQRRVGILEEGMRDRAYLSEVPADAGEPDQAEVPTGVGDPSQAVEPGRDEAPTDDDGYLQLALLHDRIHALEVSVRPTSRDN